MCACAPLLLPALPLQAPCTVLSLGSSNDYTFEVRCCSFCVCVHESCIRAIRALCFLRVQPRAGISQDGRGVRTGGGGQSDSRRTTKCRVLLCYYAVRAYHHHCAVLSLARGHLIVAEQPDCRGLRKQFEDSGLAYMRSWPLSPRSPPHTAATAQEAVLEKTPCTVDTFDCTINGTSISPRHTFHKLCLGSADDAHRRVDERGGGGERSDVLPCLASPPPAPTSLL